MTLPGNESCAVPRSRSDSGQVDLNGPTTPVTPVPPTTGSDGYLQLHNLQTIQELCCDGMSPALMTGVVMSLLANHFSNPNLIMTPALKQYVYVPGPPTAAGGTKIAIMTNTAFNSLTNAILPALVVKRLAVQTDRKSMGDVLSTSPQGQTNYVRFCTGGVRVMVLAAADSAAEALAQEVFDALSFLSPVMVERMQFMDFQVRSMGELAPLEDLGNKIGIPVDIEMVFEYAWAIKPLAPRLKTLSISVQ